MVADYLFRENIISGPIYSLFQTSQPTPPIVGIEDPDLYQANIQAVRDSYQIKDHMDVRLTDWGKDLEERKRNIIFEQRLSRFTRWNS